MRHALFAVLLLTAAANAAAAPPATYDVIIRGGQVLDGSGGPPFIADVAVTGDRIAAIAPQERGRVDVEQVGTMLPTSAIGVQCST